MYANLNVTARNLLTHETEQLAAWSVEIDPDGTATVYLDAQDGMGSYAEPAGERRFDLDVYALAIGADF